MYGISEYTQFSNATIYFELLKCAAPFLRNCDLEIYWERCAQAPASGEGKERGPKGGQNPKTRAGGPGHPRENPEDGIRSEYRDGELGWGNPRPRRERNGAMHNAPLRKNQI